MHVSAVAWVDYPEGPRLAIVQAHLGDRGNRGDDPYALNPDNIDSITFVAWIETPIEEVAINHWHHLTGLLPVRIAPERIDSLPAGRTERVRTVGPDSGALEVGVITVNGNRQPAPLSGH
jgi:hypothetical protein